MAGLRSITSCVPLADDQAILAVNCMAIVAARLCRYSVCLGKFGKLLDTRVNFGMTLGETDEHQ